MKFCLHLRTSSLLVPPRQTSALSLCISTTMYSHIFSTVYSFVDLFTSMSSFGPCSLRRCAAREAYRIVPKKTTFSRGTLNDHSSERETTH